jgi:hypothetical protein
MSIQTKPVIYKVPGQDSYACSMFIKGRPVHGYGATMRDAYFNWCIQVFGVPHPTAE